MTRCQFLRDDRGNALIEFAFVAPILIFLIFSLFEMGYVAFARSTLESATMTGARLTAAQTCAATRKTNMEALINRRTSTIAKYEGRPVRIQVLAYGDEFGDVGNPEPYTDTDRNGRYTLGESYTDVNGNLQWDSDMGRDGSLGGKGDVVRFNTEMDVPSIVPFIANALNAGRPFYRLRSSTVVRNEPVFKDECTS